MHLEICVEELDSGQVKYFKDLSIYVGPNSFALNLCSKILKIQICCILQTINLPYILIKNGNVSHYFVFLNTMFLTILLLYFQPLCWNRLSYNRCNLVCRDFPSLLVQCKTAINYYFFKSFWSRFLGKNKKMRAFHLLGLQGYLLLIC